MLSIKAESLNANTQQHKKLENCYCYSENQQPIKSAHIHARWTKLQTYIEEWNKIKKEIHLTNEGDVIKIKGIIEISCKKRSKKERETVA